MNKYMKEMNTSSTLKLGLQWKSKKAENEDELEEILENYAITKRILGGKIIPKTT
jgi:hypothetical protein